MTDAEWHLGEAARLAAANHQLNLAASVRLELGNLLAEKGDLAGAVRAYQDSIELARASRDPHQFQEVLAHNNAAYHLLLLNDWVGARTHIEAGLQLAQARDLRVSLQYLYSTRGELALGEKNWAEAEEWFRKGLAEAERNDNARQIANLHANLALAAQGRGELDEALTLLEAAHRQAAALPVPHLQIQIDLWLTELHRARNEHVAANEALKRAEARLKGSGRKWLMEWAKRLRRGTSR